MLQLLVCRIRTEVLQRSARLIWIHRIVTEHVVATWNRKKLSSCDKRSYLSYWRRSSVDCNLGTSTGKQRGLSLVFLLVPL